MKFYHFWPKNDGEKWSIKNIFEIPPCAHHVIFITEFVLLIKIPPFYEVNSLENGKPREEFQKYFSHFDQGNNGRICHIMCVNQCQHVAYVIQYVVR